MRMVGTAAAAFRFLLKSIPKPSVPAVKSPCPAPLVAGAAALWTQKRSLTTFWSVPDISCVDMRHKLYLGNLPWSVSVPDIVQLFSQCGTVKAVQLIKLDTCIAYVTMDSVKEAVTAIEKFYCYELLGRIIRVESVASFQSPTRPPPPGEPVIEPRHKIFVSNLGWKVESVGRRKRFDDDFEGVSARLVFDSLSEKSAGYGYISFATKEEEEAAISELDGKVVVTMNVTLHYNGYESLRKQLAKMEEGVPSFSIDTENKNVFVLDCPIMVGYLDNISKVKKAEFLSC